MNQKISYTELSEGLHARTHVPRRDADRFVHAFFDMIQEALVRDSIVKIKGLGTFKLMDVDTRESVDVRSGQRIAIAEHTKITFTPDPILRDAVNKPFAEFDTVMLNEGVDFAFMENVSEIPEGINENENVDDGKPSYENENEKRLRHENENENENYFNENDSEDEGREMKDEATVATAMPEEPEEATPFTPEEADATPEEPEEAEAVAAPSPRREHHCWRNTLLVLMGIVLLLGGYVAGSLDWPCSMEQAMSWFDRLTSQWTKDEGQWTEAVTADTICVDTIAAAPLAEDSIARDSVVMEEDSVVTKDYETLARQFPQIEGGKYLIVGVVDTIEMKVGMTLTRISLNYYKTKARVGYICKMNNIKNADNVPLGKHLLIPELVENPLSTQTNIK